MNHDQMPWAPPVPQGRCTRDIRLDLHQAGNELAAALRPSGGVPRGDLHVLADRVLVLARELNDNTAANEQLL